MLYKRRSWSYKDERKGKGKKKDGERKELSPLALVLAPVGVYCCFEFLLFGFASYFSSGFS